MTKKIVLTGGGTAGHVVPHLALLPYLQREKWQVSYIGSARGLEKPLVAAAGIKFYAISSGKLRRYFSWQNFTDAFKVLWGIAQAFALLIKLRPHLVFSKGGYVSVPVAIAAYFLRIKVITHESDFSPGLATRILTRFASEVWVAFAETQKDIPQAICTGMPIRDELHTGDKQKALALCEFKPNRRTLLIVGGSLGSQRINAVATAIMSELLRDFQVVHIVGNSNTATIHHSRYRAFSFVREDFKHLLALADLVVSRAGANTIFELLALQKPMLLIPLDAGSRGDQVQNADCFARRGYALVLTEKDLSGATLLAKLTELATRSDELRANQHSFQLAGDNKVIVARLAQALPKSHR